MRILGIESSTVAGSAAVVEGGLLLGEVWFSGAATHSQMLMVSVARVLEITGTNPERLSGVAVGLGPGSFTGVRVALSTAKGLAFGLGVPLAGVPTLETLAAGAPQSCGLVCPMVDARAQRIYTALFRFLDGSLQQVKEEALRELMPWLLSLQEPVLFVGDGALEYRKLIEEALGHLARFGPVECALPRAATVARLGEDKIEKGECDDLDLLAPRYAMEAKAVRDMASGRISPAS